MVRRLLFVALGAAAFLAPGCADDGGGGQVSDLAPEVASDVDAGPGDAGGGDLDAALDVAPDALGDGETGAPELPDEDVPPERICPPDVTGCFNGGLLICNKAGVAFERRPCDAGLVCFDGACVQCGTDADCEGSERCTDHLCQVPELVILTEELEPVLQGAAFAQPLEATGGEPPYAWSLDEGVLPSGVALAPDGVLSGTSTQKGEFPFFATVEDQGAQSRTVALTLRVVANGLTIKTVSPLPQGKAGEDYSVQLEALGGTPPLFWGVSAGALPVGLSLSATGRIEGQPEESGLHAFTIKVFDNADQPLVAQKDFELPVVIAPLEIIGDNPVDLFVTKLFSLPLIVVVSGIPVPYNAQLTAKGGKKPLHWSEQPLPDLVKGIIPKGGLPPGLTLNDDGSITGGVTDPNLAVSITIPFTQIALSGFVFSARVEDDQGVPFHDEALYLIPTVPLGF
ncbi:MAG: putative Ig domain-containing protein [Deltaproteobacteria bacterium]|nr:putative Ig domain-containing protein [Deltaproteobacteria bacterium]MCB9788153.1 putative Ig domain-containing protein [Deltaproteobacteria bacterium]